MDLIFQANGGSTLDTLIGLRFTDWFTLYRKNFKHIPFSQYKSCFKLTLLSLRNSVYAKKEAEAFAEQIEQTTIDQAPIFILGHWRSGTTLLHNLLCKDERFAFPNVYEVYNPWTFLITEDLVKKHLEKLPPEKRPMDNVLVKYDDPAEDEVAISLLSLKSPLIGWAFPVHEAYFDRYLTLHHISEQERAEWKKWFIYFLKKLTLRYHKPLILKSPHHTARVKTLTELFPDAKFIHIARNPYRIFQSTVSLYEKTIRNLSLQKRDLQKDIEAIIERYRVMYDFYFEERKLIQEGNLIELHFEDLVADFVGSIRSIYDQLNINGWEDYEPRLKKALESLKSYQKNVYPPIDPKWKKLIHTHWEKTFTEWHYPME